MSSKKEITREAFMLVLKRYTAQYRRYPFWAILGCLSPALGSICTTFIPPLIIARIVNTFATGGDTTFGVMGIWIAFFGLSWLLGEALWRLGFHALVQIEAKGMKNLKDEGFQELVRRDYDFFANNFVGTITKQTLAYAKNFEKFTDTIFINVFNNIIPSLFAFGILWTYSLYIPLILLICLTIVIVVAVPIIRKRMKYVALRHEAESRVAGRLSDSIANILTIKSFAKEALEKQTYETCTQDAMVKWKRAADFQNLRLDMVISPLYVMTNVLGLIAALFFAHSLHLPAGTILIVYAYYASVTRTFWDINRVYREIEFALGEAAEFTQLILKAPAVEDAPGAPLLQVQKADIEFRDVSFGYGKDGKNAAFFHGFDLTIPHNQKVGLVGPSGGGKTTLTKLLLRFLNINEGSIMIDGQNIAQVTQNSLRENIAYVPQEPLLFHRTLFENIAYGQENATEEEVIQAAKLAHAHEFIVGLPHGYQTLVGERGIKLSGGQRQRVAIARAILKKSHILVLDEATSALDSESEKYIQEGFKELMKDKTALVIAHRLSTIKNLDRIIVLAEGKIVQDGSHDQLIREKGLYATLWGHQSGEFLGDE